jgi:hypothetical protein
MLFNGQGGVLSPKHLGTKPVSISQETFPSFNGLLLLLLQAGGYGAPETAVY